MLEQLGLVVYIQSMTAASLRFGMIVSEIIGPDATSSVKLIIGAGVLMVNVSVVFPVIGTPFSPVVGASWKRPSRSTLNWKPVRISFGSLK